jgi:hypothetical protein
VFADVTLRGALSQQQRLKELQARVPPIGSALVAVLIGCANFIARVLFQEF